MVQCQCQAENLTTVAKITLTIRLMPTFTESSLLAKISRRKLFNMWTFNSYAAPSILWKRCLPFRFANQPLIHRPKNRPPLPALCTLWVAASRFGFWFCSSLRCCLILCSISNDFASSSPIRIQNGDRPDNRDVEPCSKRGEKQAENLRKKIK